MRVLPYLLYLLILACYQVILAPLIAIGGVAFDLAALLACGVALYKTEMTSLWFGFFAGLVVAVAQPDLLGWHAVGLALIAVAAFHLRDRLNVESLSARLLLVTGGALVHQLAIILIDPSLRALPLLWQLAIPAAVYTTVAAFIFFLVKDRYITIQRVRELF